MGAGQIGGLAALLDIDFENAAGFVGSRSEVSEAQYVVYFLSHAMMFCMGALVEAHVVLTAASCVYGEKYKFDVFGGTHTFHENIGTSREVQHFGVHKGYNHSFRWESCSPDNVALLLLDQQFYLHAREVNTEFVMNRLRYGLLSKQSPKVNQNCRFYGWGSRRNGYLVPLLINLQRVDVTILPRDHCLKMWDWGNKYLCLNHFYCKSEKHGALCPDDMGSVIECSGFLRGLMTSRLIDRPCGVGFLDMSKYLKFLTCGVDDSRDILGHSDYVDINSNKTSHPEIPMQILHAEPKNGSEYIDPSDPGPPTLRPTVSGEEPYEESIEKENKEDDT